jgi:hypothetical protein
MFARRSKGTSALIANQANPRCLQCCEDFHGLDQSRMHS